MKKLFTLIGAVLFATNMFAQAPDGWTSIIKNGDLTGDDFSSFYIKQRGVVENNDPMDAGYYTELGVESGVVDGEGPDGGRAIKVYAKELEEHTWDTQFWIVFNKAFFSPTKIYVRFKYKADREIGMAAQAHSITPGDYNHWDAGIGSNTFTDEWQEVEATLTVSGEQDQTTKGYGSIAFNLTPGSDNPVAADGDATYYFADFEVAVKEVVLAEFEGLNTFLNGAFELDPTEASVNPDGNINFTVRESGKEDSHEVVAGVGKENTSCVVIESIEGATQDWDTQFFITSNHVFAEGERMQVKFDFRACAVDGQNPAGGFSIDTQCHGATPGSYIHYVGIGSPTATTEWQEYDSEVITVSGTQAVAKDNDGNITQQFQTIAFNLNKNKDKAAKFYFDNIRWYLDDSDSGYTTSDDADLNDTVEEQVATGVKELKTKKAAKAMFNLAGQQVDSNYKGIVIENGQKRINK
jgi:hypothetical protein